MASSSNSNSPKAKAKKTKLLQIEKLLRKRNEEAETKKKILTF